MNERGSLVIYLLRVAVYYDGPEDEVRQAMGVLAAWHGTLYLEGTNLRRGDQEMSNKNEEPQL